MNPIILGGGVDQQHIQHVHILLLMSDILYHLIFFKKDPVFQ